MVKDLSISKSQKKRNAEALQNIGVKLIALSVHKLDKLPLTTELRHAIIQAKTIKQHGAMRRQEQLIGKLMRMADSQAILAVYDDILAAGNNAQQIMVFHETERWRNRLVNESKTVITEFITAYPDIDRQQLYQLVYNAIDEKINNKSIGAGKVLFRFLISYLS